MRWKGYLAIYISKALFKSNNIRGKKRDFVKEPVNQLHLKDQVWYSK